MPSAGSILSPLLASTSEEKEWHQLTCAILARPNDPQLWSARGAYHLRQRCPEYAATDAFRANDLGGDAYELLGDAMFEMADYAEAMKCYQRARLQTPERKEVLSQRMRMAHGKHAEGLNPQQALHQGRVMAWFNPRATLRDESISVDDLNKIVQQEASICRVTVGRAPSHGGLGLYATKQVAKGGVLLCEPDLFTITLDSRRCQVCARLPYPRTLIRCEDCGAEVYCSERCQRVAWDSYHCAQCGEVSQRIDALRDELFRTVEAQQSSLYSSFKPLAMCRIAGMVQAHATRGDGDFAGGWPPKVGGTAALPPLLRRLVRLTDAADAPLLDLVKHPFMNWVGKWARVKDALMLDTLDGGAGHCLFDFRFYEEVDHALAGNCIGCPAAEGAAVTCMRGMTYANHSCAPNARVSGDEEGRMRLVALRDLKEGEEVFISYIDLKGEPSTAERREFLRLKYWFDCHCSRCTRGA
jgi:hypothetical protein